MFGKNFFPRHLLLERLTYDAQTPPFAITIKETKFYQDPSNPSERRITATLDLTHEVAPGELERHIQLVTIGGSSIFPPSDPPPLFLLPTARHRVSAARSLIFQAEDFMKSR